MTQLTEAAIAVTLARAIDSREEGRWAHGDTIGYARTSNDREIDLAPVAISTQTGSAMTTPLESKWVDKGWKGEARTITGKYDRGVITTKTILDLDGPVWAVPAPLIALSLL